MHSPWHLAASLALFCAISAVCSSQEPARLPQSLVPQNQVPPPNNQNAAPQYTDAQKQELAEADRLNKQVVRLFQAGEFSDAVIPATRAVEIRERILGPEDPLTALSVFNLATQYKKLGDFAKALPLFQRALAIREKVLGKDHSETADSLESLASLYGEKSDYKAALPLAKRALEIKEISSGKDHPDTARSLNTLAHLYRGQGEYTAALPLYKRALAIIEIAMGKDHPVTAAGLNNLACCYLDLGDFAAAIPLMKRAIEIYEKDFGKDHLFVAPSLNSLAALYETKGDYVAAIPLLKRALEIREKGLPKDHPETALSLHNLARAYRLEGDYSAAMPLFQRAIKIREKALGEDNPDTAKSLINLAALYCDQENFAAAKRLARRALKIQELALGGDHPDTGESLRFLGVLYRAEREYSAALPLFERSLELKERALGKDHHETASDLNDLALVYYYRGDYAVALPLAKRALETTEKALGKDHPATAEFLDTLGLLYLGQEDYASAIPFFEGAIAVCRRVLETTAAVQSDRQQMRMAEALRFHTDAYLSCLASSKTSLAVAYPRLLEEKGTIFMRQRWARLTGTTGDDETRRVLGELQAASSRLTSLAFSVPTSQQRAAWERQVGEMGAEKERLEVELGRMSAAYRQEQARRKRSVAEIQDALPGNAVLVDFVEYTHGTRPEKKGDEWTYERRLLAFLVSHKGPVKVVQLKGAATIDAAVQEWRERLGAANTGESDAGQKLRELVWDKLEPEIGDAHTVLISPDGALAKIPWGALPGKPPGKFLIEQRAIAVVAVPQALPDLRTASDDPRSKTPDKPSLLCISDIEYGAAPGKAPPTLVMHRAALANDKGRPEFSRLGMTGEEAEQIRKQFVLRFPGGIATSLHGTAATKEAFRAEAPKNRWLHVATHGFFADPKLKSAYKSNDKDHARQLLFFDEEQRHAVGWDPGVLSGLALAGANRTPQEGEEDGILTAAEVASMELGRIDIAVLSACETGLGESADGEGLLGLQRAFQVAGAKNVVASLWKVDDAATQALMTEFYTNLWQKKLPPIEALRQAQLKMLVAFKPTEGKLRAGFEDTTFDEATLAAARKKFQSNETTLPPFYWAAFVLSGSGK